MVVNFQTPTLLSPLDISSMGDSSKRGDETKIGQFDSGLKYAIALLMRNKVTIDIQVFNEQKTWNYCFITQNKKCEYTNKEKELIVVWCQEIDEEGITTKEYEIETSFSVQLGYNWELWMAFRELYSNMLDEKGFMTVDSIQPIEFGTRITLTCDTDSGFAEIINRKYHYILSPKEPRYCLENGIEIIAQRNSYLKIYKQSILVYENKEIPSYFRYNIPFGEIDERRVLKDDYGVGRIIYDTIRSTKNKEFLQSIIREEPFLDKDEWLNRFTEWYETSDVINEMVNSSYNIRGEVYTIEGLMKGIQKRPDCKVPGRIIKSLNDHVWNASKEVKLKRPAATIALVESVHEETVVEKIERMYRFKVDCELKQSELSGSKCICDKYNKCIVLDTSFDPATDFDQFIVQYIDLKFKGNIITNMAKFIESLIKK